MKRRELTDKKGVSMISLIITIIVILILSMIAINVGFKSTMEKSDFTRRISEMTEVYDAIIQRGIEHGIDSTMYPYEGTELSDISPIEINGIKYGDGYYYIETDAQKAKLKLERVRGKYIANYETGDVVSEMKIEYEGKDYYRLADISGAVQPGSVTTVTGEYDIAQGVNKPIITDGMVPVKPSGEDKWVVTTEADTSWYDYANGKYATMMLVDELTLNNTSNAEVRKMTRAQLDALSGSEIKVQGSTFIWIPRYTYKVDETGKLNIMFSHLIDDYTEDNYIKNPAFYFGQYTGSKTEADADRNTGYLGGGKELTGIWISKYEAGFNI